MLVLSNQQSLRDSGFLASQNNAACTQIRPLLDRWHCSKLTSQPLHWNVRVGSFVQTDEINSQIDKKYQQTLTEVESINWLSPGLQKSKDSELGERHMLFLEKSRCKHLHLQLFRSFKGCFVGHTVIANKVREDHLSLEHRLGPKDPPTWKEIIPALASAESSGSEISGSDRCSSNAPSSLHGIATSCVQRSYFLLIAIFWHFFSWFCIWILEDTMFKLKFTGFHTQILQDSLD